MIPCQKKTVQDFVEQKFKALSFHPDLPYPYPAPNSASKLKSGNINSLQDITTLGEYGKKFCILLSCVVVFHVVFKQVQSTQTRQESVTCFSALIEARLKVSSGQFHCVQLCNNMY